MDIPPQPLIDYFQEIAKPIDDKVIENYRQICTLEELRDILLPRMMSGEVGVEG
jgi:type I restriction enzyme S subunit